MNFNQNTDLTTVPVSSEGYTLLSLQGLYAMEIVFVILLNGSVCLFGIISNIINMIIFIMKGLDNTMNISFFAMAISDLLSVLSVEWLSINLNPFMKSANIAWDPADMSYLSAAWPHACSARITCWITVYITAERCLCIALPIKVKQIITPSRTKLFIAVIYAFMVLTLLPEYMSMYLGEKYSTVRNRTLVGLVDTPYKARLEGVCFVIYTVLGFISFFLLVLFTCILVIKLKQQSEWRAKTTFDKGQSAAISNRDKKTMKMVVLISTILIISFTPSIILFITGYVEPEFDLGAKYTNEFQATWPVAFLSESINSSVNIILYYKMSTKYRETFNKLFSICIKPDTSQ